MNFISEWDSFSKVLHKIGVVQPLSARGFNRHREFCHIIWMKFELQIRELFSKIQQHGGDDVLAHREHSTTIRGNFHSIRSWSHSFLVTQERYHRIAKSLNFVAVYKKHSF